MKPSLRLVLLASLLFPSVVRSQVTLGTTVAAFPCVPTKLLADPARNRVYIADTTTNSVLVVDTTTLQVAATITVGSAPQDLAISPDGTTLYAANNGSQAAAVAVLDLNALTLKGSFALPYPAQAIATGLNNQIYVSAGTQSGVMLYQLDGTSGTVQSTTYGVFNEGDHIQISPDKKTLFIASDGELLTYDVSGAVPAAAQHNSYLNPSSAPLAVSHNGKYVCLPAGQGNSSGGDFYTTYLLSTADINSRYGEFKNGPYPGPLTFSLDDSLVYQVGASITLNEQAYPLQVFSTQSFALVATAQFTNLGPNVAADAVTSITTDNTGSYLFVAETALANGGPSKVGQVVVVGTGAGTLAPSPTLSLAATTPSVVSGSGGMAEFTLTLASATPVDLHVAYSVKGTATNGTDYVMLKGTAKIKAGKASKAIKVVPEGDLGSASKKTVVLTLQPGTGYTVGTTGKVKVKILAPGK